MIVRRLVLRLVLGGVLGVIRRPRTTLVLIGLSLTLSVALALGRLQLSSNQNELFSANVPFFRDYLRFVHEFPENEAVYVVVRATDPAAPLPVARWTTLADAIAARLRTLPRHVRSVDHRIPLDELGAQGILFENAGNLERIYADARRFVPLVRLWGEAPDPLRAAMGGTPSARFLSAVALAPEALRLESAPLVALIARSWEVLLRAPAPAPPPAGAGAATGTLTLRPGHELPDLRQLDASDPSRLGYYFTPDASAPDRSLLLIRVVPRLEYTGLTAVSETIDAIRTEVRAAAAPFPEFLVGITGRPVLEADEMRTTDQDSTRAEIVALITVFVGLVVLLRSLRLALVAEVALAVGIGWTFGWATLALGRLNLLSIVFIIALIGIGMDNLIQLLARYRAEFLPRPTRHHNERPFRNHRASWLRVYRHIGPAITTGSLGAACAFLVAATTDFRGAAELGIIAGVGLLLCLLAGYTAVPALLTLFPWRPAATDAREPHAAAAPPSAAPGAHQPQVHRRPTLIGPIAWLALLAAGVPFLIQSRFDPGLIKLQAANLESVQLVRVLQTWSAVVLAPDLDALRDARRLVGAAPTVASTESILNAYDNAAAIAAMPALPDIAWAEPVPLRPGDLAELARRAAALAQSFEAMPQPGAADAARALRGFLAAFPSAAEPGAPAESRAATQAAARLSEWQRAFSGQLREQLDFLRPREPDLHTLPAGLRTHLVSEAGTLALYIYPKGDAWEREVLDAFVSDVESRLAPLGSRIVLTGIAHNIHHSTRAIERAFYASTGLAAACIIVLVLLDFRSLRLTAAALSVLLLGLPLLGALMVLIGVSWNFANFFGLPILIGAAHEYGVFMVHRYLEARRDPRRAWRGWDASDRALLLCAFTTFCSFGFFFLLAHHQGLRSLGLVMALGSACIYFAALCVLRPLLKRQFMRSVHTPHQNGCSDTPAVI